MRLPAIFKNLTLFMRAARGKDQYRKKMPSRKAGRFRSFCTMPTMLLSCWSNPL